MKNFLALLLMGLLAGCSPERLPLEKAAPEPVTANALVSPPWQTMVKAGAGAAHDIDVETLNGPQGLAPQPTPAAPDVADAAAPPPSASPVVQDKAEQAPKPGATVIKAVAMTGVSGASGQGNVELAAAMRKVLANAGWPVVAKAAPDALTITGKVALDAPSGATQMVHIVWTVASPKGKVLGTVGQNNAVPAHSLDASWGETSSLAAQAAGDGIFKVVGGYR